MTLAEVRAWAHVKQSDARFYETVEPEGYRILCEHGWLTECEPRNPNAMQPVYRFEITLAGSTQRTADRPYHYSQADA